MCVCVILDYHMHETLLPQTIITIVKAMVENYDQAAFTENGFIACPYEYEYDTVAMFIDVSGFTKMTELLDAEGPWGMFEGNCVLSLI